MTINFHLIKSVWVWTIRIKSNWNGAAPHYLSIPYRVLTCITSIDDITNNISAKCCRKIAELFRVTGTFVANIWEDCSWITYTKTKIIVITQWNVFHLVILQQNWAMYTPNKRWWMGDQVWIYTDNKYEVFFLLPNLSLLTFMLGIHFLWHIITLRKHNPFLLGECVKNWSVFWLFLTLYFNME